MPERYLLLWKRSRNRALLGFRLHRHHTDYGVFDQRRRDRDHLLVNDGNIKGKRRSLLTRSWGSRDGCYRGRRLLVHDRSYVLRHGDPSRAAANHAGLHALLDHLFMGRDYCRGAIGRLCHHTLRHQPLLADHWGWRWRQSE
jgi:hypothetical protein